MEGGQVGGVYLPVVLWPLLIRLNHFCGYCPHLLGSGSSKARVLVQKICLSPIKRLRRTLTPGYWHSPWVHSCLGFRKIRSDIQIYSWLSMMFLLLHPPLLSGDKIDQDSGKGEIFNKGKNPISISPLVQENNTHDQPSNTKNPSTWR